MKPLPKLIYMPEESTPTIATEGNREAVAYLELGEHADYYGRLFAAAELLLEALEAQEFAECDREAGIRKGYFDHARELRKAAIAAAKGGAS